MGKTIERIAQDRGHDVVQRVSTKNAGETPVNNADVAIEFSTPFSAEANIKACINASIPIIVGTTGWLEHLDEISMTVNNNNGALLHASNFSIGVNIFFEVNKLLAELMNGRTEYTPLLQETHHVHKLDAPSGTAITIANDLIDRNEGFEDWSEKKEAQKLQVVSYRENEVPGTHLVSYRSAIDDITIEHKAHNREGFAVGAVLAAEWIIGRTGVFTMKDLLNF